MAKRKPTTDGAVDALSRKPKATIRDDECATPETSTVKTGRPKKYARETERVSLFTFAGQWEALEDYSFSLRPKIKTDRNMLIRFIIDELTADRITLDGKALARFIEENTV